MIEIRNLFHEYPDGTKSLEGIDLDIPKDKLTAIIGGNGAGKSTLLMHINGLLKAKKGTVTINGMQVQRNLLKIRRLVGHVFQNPDDMLFTPTVYDDVAFGPRNLKLPKDAVHERVHEALFTVQMNEFKHKNPHHLGLGQKKRVSIASVLSMKPDIIVFDEPTSHLDPKGKREIMELIQSLKCTRIIATHDMSLLQYCDLVYILEAGKIVYSGTEVNSKVLKEYGLE